MVSRARIRALQAALYDEEVASCSNSNNNDDDHHDDDDLKEEDVKKLALELREVADLLLTGREGSTGRLKTAKTKATGEVTRKDVDAPPRRKRTKQERGPDFSKSSFQHVALKIAYFGWNYYGFARSKDGGDTVEAKLFSALVQCRLIPPGSGPTAHVELNYSRCGRTDKGVSASGQVVALKLRSCDRQTLDYVAMINRFLPDDIRVLGSALVDASFHARFGATLRHYKYYFVQGDVEKVERMKYTCANFVGQHDFRNFCKSSDSVESYVRTIHECYIEEMDEETRSQRDVFAFNVIGSAFLWHQVRCMASVLFSTGEGTLHHTKDVQKYLDIAQQTERPSYTMAKEEPLLLYKCNFEQEVDFDISSHASVKLKAHLSRILHDLVIRTQLVKQVLGLLVTPD